MTYQVAILDDEQLIREGITLKYPFKENGFEIVFSGDDGNVLLECMANKTVVPDIIFVDMLMPRLNGLAFIEKLRDASPIDVEIVIISGHDEFEFAQKAIRLRVKEYLLKPLNPIDLERVMNNIINDLKRKQEKREEQVQDEIENWLISSRQQQVQLTMEAAQLVDSILHRHNHMYLVLFGNLQSRADDYQKLRTYFKGEHDFEISTSSEYNLFVHFDLRDDYIHQLFQHFDFQTITIAHFEACRNREVLPRIVAYGVNWLHHKITLEQRIYESLNCEGTKEDTLLKLGNDEYLEWKQFESSMRQQKVSLDKLRKLIEKPLPQYLKENMIQQFAREFLQYEISKEWMQQFDTASEFVEECLYLIQNAADAVRPTKGKDIVKSVLKDMESEYFMNLTLKDYADRYHIHPNHLVRLFKQEIESTFYQSLVEIRMKKAEKALAQTQLKIIEIAAEVGYEDPGYFAQVFRKYHHITPNEYRKRFQNG